MLAKTQQKLSYFRIRTSSSVIIAIALIRIRNLKGDDIFERMHQKYADCRTYSDSGRIESENGRMTFKTYFVRPNLFKFEYAHYPNHHPDAPETSGTIWSDGNEFFSTNHDLNHVPCENIASLLLEIGHAAQEASCLVPMMLLSDYAGPQCLSDAEPYVQAEHTSVADRSCHRIKSANIDFPYEADLLIDSLGYKLRRMIIAFKTGLRAEVLFSNVTFDREISEDIFNLKHD